MKTKSLIFLLLASLCLITGLHAFDGKMDMTVTRAKESEKPRTLSISIKGERMRGDFLALVDSKYAEMGAVATILDRGKHEKTLLFLDKKMYVTHSLKGKMADKIGDNFTKLQYKHTGKKEKIAGEEGLQYVATNLDDGSYHELWVTPELGKFLDAQQGVGGSVDPGDLSAQSLWTQFAFKQDFMILRAIIRETAGGADRFLLEVTKIDRAVPDDSLFEIPADFKKME